MNYHFFRICAIASQADTALLNQFLQQHRIISVDREFVCDGQNSFWSVCVGSVQSEKSNLKIGRKSIDYRDVLAPDVFAVFSRLRELRKRLAAEQGVPPYAIFTNEQLSQIAQLPNPSCATIQSIEGVGDKRIELYVDLVLQTLGQGHG